MAGPSTQFKKLLLEHDRGSRDRILYKLSNWVFEQHPMDPLAAQCSSVLQQLCNDNGYQSEMAFQTNPKWYVLLNSDQCVSLQQIVDAKLAIPVPPPPAIPVSPPPAIPVVAPAAKKPMKTVGAKRSTAAKPPETVAPVARIGADTELTPVEDIVEVKVRKTELGGRDVYLDAQKGKVYDLKFHYLGRWDSKKEKIVAHPDSDTEC